MKFFLLIGLIIFPFIGFCDTLDYWTIHLNENELGKYNSASENIEIVLKMDSISDSDTIYITYGNDHPCVRCEYYHAVKDIESRIKIHVNRLHVLNKTVSYPLKKLIEFFGKKDFVFFVYEDDWTGKSNNVYTELLKLKIE
ncbi:MAG: hypothetical protein ABJG68_07355 [Crocinitomicaceae bacterium]